MRIVELDDAFYFFSGGLSNRRSNKPLLKKRKWVFFWMNVFSICGELATDVDTCQRFIPASLRRNMGSTHDALHPVNQRGYLANRLPL
jgi:hypothetical protein